MVLDTKKKPIGETAGGSSDRTEAKKRLDLNKKPITSPGSAADTPAPSDTPAQDSRGRGETRWPLFLAAVAAVVGIGFLALHLFGGNAREAGEGGTAAGDAAGSNRSIKGDAAGPRTTGSTEPAPPASAAETGAGNVSPAGSEAEAKGVTAGLPPPSSSGHGEARGPVEPDRPASAGNEAAQGGRESKNEAGGGSAVTTVGRTNVADPTATSAVPGGGAPGLSKHAAGTAEAVVRKASAGSTQEDEAGASSGRDASVRRSLPYPERPPAATTDPSALLLTVRFELNSAAISPEEEGRIRSEIGDVAGKAPRGVLVEGFTCSLGTEEFNRDLARRRADAVVDVIRASIGGAPVQIEERAFGERHPVAPNDTENGRRENRRVIVSKK